MKKYNHLAIEKKWQKEWDKSKIYRTKDTGGKKFYVLDMFPYPSGQGLHVGHPRGYIASDVYARQKRAQGYNVLHPMGYDAFGLPAEQYAIANKIHPRQAVLKNVATFRKQLEIIGFSYDWTRSVNTTDPEYYRWTQWIFLKLYGSWYNPKTNRAEDIKTLIKTFDKKDWSSKSEKEKQEILMRYRLAYEGYSEVNWCPGLGTVLANDEVVNDEKGNPVSERGGFPVEKKTMRQWFMRVTAYAEKLLAGLDTIDWPNHIKDIQRNWIGRSEGSEFDFAIKNSENTITIFTTRADTIFGVTYVVLAPENKLVQKLSSKISNWNEVQNYINEVKNKDDEARLAADKEKTGVQLKGIVAINPVNGEEVPVWIADYVLATYGTGAVMAVPAHDDRDFKFANKYNLSIKRVVEPKFVAEEATGGHGRADSAVKPGLPMEKRNAVCVFVKNPKDDKYLCIKWRGTPMNGLVTGGIDGDESYEETAMREVHEETGYKNLKLVKEPDFAIHSLFYHRLKNTNRWARFQYVFLELINEERDPVAEKEAALHEVVWKSKDELKEFFTVVEGEFIINFLNNPNYIFTEDGVLFKSGEFDFLDSSEARRQITEKFGRSKITYKIRDAVFARQRYWGEPIPLLYDRDGIIHEVPEKKLPLKLPEVKSYEPIGTGESPLAGVKSWTDKGYETNTMPGWAGSSWYFLRYMDPNNKKVFASPKNLKYWKNVDMYVGGAEHATGHLIYSRFWHKFLHDLKLVPTAEPFMKLRNQGMILGTDQRKMSKRWGNVINPDDMVKLYGADTLRVYEMFMGPFDQSLPWSTESIIGSRRFIEKVWRLSQKVGVAKSDKDLESLLNKTIKKVGEDIESMNFNTAISALMILLNAMEKRVGEYGVLSVKVYEVFLQLLAPFAPHVTEELWKDLGHKSSIQKEKWPKYDPKKLLSETVQISVQINGKLRDSFEAVVDEDEKTLQNKAIMLENVKKWIDGKEIKRVIFVKNRLINIVI
ncbi:MAG: class I tRNA ligase family protein [bacterium]